MNHLRELLDQLEKGAFRISEALPIDEANEIADYVMQLGESATCFWLGDIENMLSLTTIGELVRLPYPLCWFELQVYAPAAQGKQLLAGILVHEQQGKVDCFVFTRLAGEWALLGTVRAKKFSDHKVFVKPSTDGPFNPLLMSFNAAQAFLSALHCTNVSKELRQPDDRLQHAREKRGKAPLFSYWTLKLQGRRTSSECQGGTHASPRVHLRRGHPRQYAPGKWTWIQAHAVGNRALGMVHKDYSTGSDFLK